MEFGLSPQAALCAGVTISRYRSASLSRMPAPELSIAEIWSGRSLLSTEIFVGRQVDVM